MITNTNSITPQLDSTQLRAIADLLRDRQSVDSLVQQFEFESERELMVETARAMGLEWFDGDESSIDRACLRDFR